MSKPVNYDFYIAALEQAGELGLHADATLTLSLDPWGNDWDGLDIENEVDIRLGAD